MNNGQIINSSKEIVEQFNDYFVNIGPKLAKAIPKATTQIPSYLKNSPANSLSLFLTDRWEVTNIVNDLQDKTSFGYDGIPVDIVEKCFAAIAKPLASLVKCSFRSGCFPDQLKVAKVCPVYQSGPENEFSNYRSIFILLSFSKIFEKAAYICLEKFLSSNDSLTNCQYGFRPKHSTYMALIDMYNQISESQENRNYTIGIFIDLSKAFDTIDHSMIYCVIN